MQGPNRFLGAGSESSPPQALDEMGIDGKPLPHRARAGSPVSGTGVPTPHRNYLANCGGAITHDSCLQAVGNREEPIAKIKEADGN